ncbi:MAG: hypothetical protein KC766_31335 [Myxococcales bacterium]|nr:hypothetical protein [Myxococcales bacterium]
MEYLDPLKLDRTLRRTATEWVRWSRRLRDGQVAPLAAFELQRWALGKSCFGQLRELHEADPLRGPLLRWVYRLADARINQGALLEQTHELRVKRQRVQSENEEISLAALKHRALRPPGALAERLGRRAALLEALSRHGNHYRAVTATLWQRRLEIARRMGLESPDEIELPTPESAALAHAWLERTQDAWRSLSCESLSHAIEVSLDVRDDHGWPARINAQSLRRLLDEGDLFRSLELDPGPLPAALGGASFLRAMARVGAAWHDAASPRDQPFVVAFDPYGLRRRSVGARFALLALNPDYVRRRLDLSGPRLAQHLRCTAQSLLCESRVAALRVLLRAPAMHTSERFTQTFEEHARRTLGAGVDPRLCGPLIELHPDDAQRFVAPALAAVEIDRLRDAHDEDWYRNPRGIEQLRAEAARPPAAQVAAVDFDPLARALLEHLS